MRKIITIAAVSAVLNLVSAEAEQIKLVTGKDYKPYAGESLPAGGLTTDIVRNAYEEAGYTVKIDFMPWKRGKRMVEKGHYIGTFPYIKTEKRKKTFHYSDAIIVTKAKPIVAAANSGSISSYDDFKGKSVCLPIGYDVANSKLKDMISYGDVAVLRPPKLVNCVLMVKADRAHFTVAPPLIVLNIAKDYLGSTDAISVEEFVINENELHLIAAKSTNGAKKAIKDFNRALNDLRESGVHQKIVNKHLE